MSQSEFVATLIPERQLSIWFVVSIVLALAAGSWAIANLAISTELRWFGWAGWALAILVQGGRAIVAQSCRRTLLVHADGAAVLQEKDGASHSVAFGKNSIVLLKLAWLDLTTDDGQRFSLLFRGNSRESEHWRRFQVIWRHMGSGL